MGKVANGRPVKDNQALSENSMLRGSPRKLNLLAEMIRGMRVDAAMSALSLSPKGVAPEVYKVLISAVANAEHNHGLDINQLVVAEATVGKAVVMKRFRARAKGRAGPIKKPFSKIRIVVEEQEEIA